MTLPFYIWTKIGKFTANLISAFLTDREQRHRMRYKLDPLNPERCVAYLEKHYSQEPALETVNGERLKNVIWVCWLQGIDQAPRIVQNCINSIEQNCPQGWKVIVLTADNYSDYIHLPAIMTDKWKRGMITNTHFSDLLRIYALVRHGGCWIDATCLMTAPIPQEIVDSPLFLFHTHGEFAYTYIQSCFIRAQPSQYVLRKWCACIKKYWEHEDRLINYFTLHLMFVALLHRDKLFSQEFAQVPIISDEPMHLLLHEIAKGSNYSDDLMTKARKASFIQKLTYKFPAEMLDNKESLVSVLSKQTEN